MKFLNRLLGKKPSLQEFSVADEPKIASQTTPLPKTDVTVEFAEVDGEDVGNKISSLIVACETEELVPIASLKIICNNCGAAINLDYHHAMRGEGIGYRLKNSFVNLDHPLVCEECQADSFRIENSKVNFKNWMAASLNALAPCKDDLDEGFLGSESGQPIHDHGFVKVASFEELWSGISTHVNSSGTIIENFTFNYLEIKDIGPKRINRTIGVSHQNEFSHELTVIVKDNKGNLWYRILQE